MPELCSHNRSDRDLSLLGGLIITLIYSAWSRKKRINQTLCHCFLKVKTFDCSQRQRKWYISVIPPKTTNTSTQKTEQAAYYYRPPPKTPNKPQNTTLIIYFTWFVCSWWGINYSTCFEGTQSSDLGKVWRGISWPCLLKVTTLQTGRPSWGSSKRPALGRAEDLPRSQLSLSFSSPTHSDTRTASALDVMYQEVTAQEKLCFCSIWPIC